MRKLIYIDSSFRLSEIRQRNLQYVLAIRFLDGFFSEVWSAHPADIPSAGESAIAATGPPLVTPIADGHVFVRGRYGRFKALSWASSLNSFLALTSFVFTLTGIARRENVKVIRAGDPLLCGSIGLLVAWLAGAKLVVRVNADHDLIRANVGGPVSRRVFRFALLEKWIEKLVLQRADRVLVPSEFYGDFAKRKGASPDRIVLVSYGNLVDPRHLVPPHRRSAPDDRDLCKRLNERPWLVYVGRLKELKHAEDCYEVLRRLAPKFDDAGLLMIGDGPLRKVINAKAEVDGLKDRVLLLGNIDQGALASILPRCTVALSTLTGRALAEVAFAGVPVVAYDLDWQSKLVQTDSTGILTPPRDIEAMTHGAATLLADESLRARLGTAIRERAFKLLDPAEQTRKEIEAYSSLGAF